MKKFGAFLLALVGFTVNNAFGQQEAQFTQYMNTPIFYNPAIAGLEGGTRFLGLYRNQWLGYAPSNSADGSGGISSFMLSGSTKLPEIGGGLGIHYVQDVIGPRRVQEIQLSYAYHINLGEDKVLSIGVRGGVGGQTIDGSLYRPTQENDPVVNALAGVNTAWRPEAAAGIYYNSETFFGGISASRLYPSKYDFGVSLVGSTFENAAVMHTYATLGYHFALNEEWKITPSALVRYVPSIPGSLGMMVDANLMLNYSNTLFFGGSYRAFSNDASPIIGVGFGKNKEFRLFYSLDVLMPNQAVEALSRTSHEVSFAYVLPFAARIPRPQIKTPRFR